MKEVKWLFCLLCKGIWLLKTAKKVSGCHNFEHSQKVSTKNDKILLFVSSLYVQIKQILGACLIWKIPNQWNIKGTLKSRNCATFFEHFFKNVSRRREKSYDITLSKTLSRLQNIFFKLARSGFRCPFCYNFCHQKFFESKKFLDILNKIT